MLIDYSCKIWNQNSINLISLSKFSIFYWNLFENLKIFLKMPILDWKIFSKNQLWINFRNTFFNFQRLKYHPGVPALWTTCHMGTGVLLPWTWFPWTNITSKPIDFLKPIYFMEFYFLSYPNVKCDFFKLIFWSIFWSFHLEKWILKNENESSSSLEHVDWILLSRFVQSLM